jgi:predicted protein tyrosine phosphatase
MPYSNNYFTKMKSDTTMQEFSEGTKNAAIFTTSAPYSNPYQGSSERWLFVCSAGLLRSPTGAALAVKHGINARSCGSNFNYALIPCSANLINWANKIIFVNKENLWQLEDNFLGHQDLLDQIDRKKIVLNIPDNFEYMDPQLQQFFEDELFKTYGPVTGM